MKFRNKHISIHNELSNLFSLFYPFFKFIEKIFLKNNKSDKFPVFIIGAPRTGSTILYQYLTNFLDLIYIDNVVHLFPLNPLFGLKISEVLYQNKAHNTFKSNFGLTHHYSMRAPSECSRFWTKNTTNEGRLKQSIDRPINYYDKYFLFKNLSVSLKLPLIAQIEPKSKFIWMKRNVEEVAYSILNARINRMGNEHTWFSLRPEECNNIDGLTIYEQIIAQIYYIEKRIFLDLQKNFTKDDFIIIDYTDLSQLDHLIEKVRSFIDPKIKYRKIVNIKNDNFVRKDKEVKLHFKSIINKYDWEYYTN